MVNVKWKYPQRIHSLVVIYKSKWSMSSGILPLVCKLLRLYCDVRSPPAA